MPFKPAEPQGLESITEDEIKEVLAYKNIPMQLVKTWLAIYIVLHGNSTETMSIVGNNFRGAWEFIH